MARKEILELEVKTNSKKAEKEFEKVEKGVKDLNKEVENTSKSTKKLDGDVGGLTGKLDSLTGGAISGFKNMFNSVKAVTVGFKSLRFAIIATGIGALVIGILAVGAAFRGSEEGQNKFNKILAVTGAIIGNFVDLLADLGDGIINTFENPKKSIEDFAKLIQENITNRLEGLTELIPQLGKAVELLFKGQFAEAAQVATDATGKVVLGVENLTEKINQSKDALNDFINEQIREGQEAANVAEMRAKADKIERKLVIDRANKENEIAQLRLKSRQEQEFSAKERRQALLDAQDLQDELLADEKEALQLRADAQTLENTFSRSNKANLDEEARLIAAVIQQEAKRTNSARQTQRELNTLTNQIQGKLKSEQKAEQKIQEDKINKEVKDEEDRLKKLEEVRKNFEKLRADEEANTEVLKLELEQERRITELELLDATESQKADIKLFYQDKINEAEQTASDQRIKISQKEAQDKKHLEDQVFNAKVGIALNVLQLARETAGEGTKVAKIAAIAQATISGIQGTVNAFQTAAANPITTFFPAYPFIQGGLAAGFSALQIGKIASSGSGGASAPSTGGGASRATAAAQAPQAIAPSFNIVGDSGSNQITDAINTQGNRPTRAYVVSKDITSQQALDRNTQDNSSLG
jgi:hypothetical protein